MSMLIKEFDFDIIYSLYSVQVNFGYSIAVKMIYIYFWSHCNYIMIYYRTLFRGYRSSGHNQCRCIGTNLNTLKR